jgi:acyl-CoA thioesterase-1
VSRFSAIVPLAVIAILLAGCATGAGGRASSRASGAASAAAGSGSGSGSATLVGHPTVVAIGDSIMKGDGLTAAEAWPALMAGQNGWRLDNLACDGAGFLAVGNDSDCGEAFAGLVAKAVALHPRTVIIEGSSNDFGESNDALMPETVAQLAQLRAALPDAQIIGLSTIWGDTSVPAQLTDIDEQMRVAVTRVGGHFLQIGQPLGGHPEWMQSDDVHPTADGQLAIYASVQAAFAVSHLHG